MIIDRNNYEEFFILYIDNELTAADRCKIESFIEKHPDLKEELDILQQHKLVPDANIVFEGKESLMISMTASGEVFNILNDNYQQWLLLYIDNELSPSQKTAAEKLIRSNSLIEKELELLQRTKLQPGTEIVFGNKASLYRTVETGKLRIPAHTSYQLFRRFRVAAAIVILIGLGITAALVINNRSGEPAVVKTPTPGKVTPIIDNEGHSQESPKAEIAREEKNIKHQSPLHHPVVSKNVATNRAVPVRVNNNIANDISISPQKETVAQTSNNLPQPWNDPYVTSDKEEKSVVSNDEQGKPNKVTALTNPGVTTASGQPSEYIYASAIEEPEKKNKLRGIFRKLTRTLEKRTNIDATDDGNKLLVAGLSIKLK